uniref:Uncharacterized protein n=1 Tax=Trichinella nativa TaxID=6335 RepID=A0A0V1KI73_9BILA
MTTELWSWGLVSGAWCLGAPGTHMMHRHTCKVLM